MKVAVAPRHVTPVHFLRRARYYRLAEAVADAPQDVAMFGELAVMFERLAAHLYQVESGKVSERKNA
jgi:hypothetical protein